MRRISTCLSTETVDNRRARRGGGRPVDARSLAAAATVRRRRRGWPAHIADVRPSSKVARGAVTVRFVVEPVDRRDPVAHVRRAVAGRRGDLGRCPARGDEAQRLGLASREALDLRARQRVHLAHRGPQRDPLVMHQRNAEMVDSFGFALLAQRTEIVVKRGELLRRAGPASRYGGAARTASGSARPAASSRQSSRASQSNVRSRNRMYASRVGMRAARRARNSSS
ncbi:putative terpene cyclase domain protein [Burkholderia pseudomallei ABCPW 107]|nr:putative terpene cyclase domain protein [Burkholderia pseudomallei ABCPW 107]